MQRYRITVPNWYSGTVTTEFVNGKETVVAASKVFAWSVGKDIWEVSIYYRQRPGGTIEPIGSKKVIRRKKRRVVRIRRKSES